MPGIRNCLGYLTWKEQASIRESTTSAASRILCTINGGYPGNMVGKSSPGVQEKQCKIVSTFDTPDTDRPHPGQEMHGETTEGQVR